MSILEGNMKEAYDAALGETSYVEEVLVVYLEYDEVSEVYWEDGLEFSTGALVNTYSSSVVSNDIITEEVLRVYFEDDEVAVAGWEDGWWFSTIALVNT